MNQVIFEIGGEERGFKLGVGFLGDLLKHYDQDIMGIGHLMVKNPYDMTPTILFFAHKHYCLRQSRIIDFTIYDVQDWIEELKDPMNDPNIENLLKMLVDDIKKYLPKKKEGSGDDEKKR